MQKMKVGGDVREATRQQKLFVDEYLKLRKSNQTQAAINAGYSKKSASSQAYQLLQNPIVLSYLEEKEKAIEQELRAEFIFDAIDARKVMFEIMIKEDAEDRDKITVAKDFLDRAGFKAIDKQEVTGKDGGPIEITDAREKLIEKLAKGKK